MTAEEVIELMEKCRIAQKTYFRTKHATDLNVAKDAERRLDKALLEWRHRGEIDLFEGQESQ